LADASLSAADVTAIITVLNGAVTIGRAIESVKSQTGGCEAGPRIVVIDGRSTDGTVERIPRLSGIQILTQRSQGLAGARNEAMAAVTTPLVAFCDADDEWAPMSLVNKLERLGRSPTAWAVSGEVRFVARGSDRAGRPVRRKPGTQHRGLTPGAILMWRSAFDRVGKFDETLTVGSDADWIVRAVQTLGPIDFLDTVVLDKGIRAGSLSTDAETYRKDLQVVARRLIERTRGNSQL